MTQAGDRIIKSAKQALAFARGEDVEGMVVHEPPPVDVKAIRKRLKLSQKAFAERFHFSAAAVRDWEQGRRRPQASAHTLLMVIDREPEAVLRALNAEG